MSEYKVRKTDSSRLRERLDHPVIDGDAHINESRFAFPDFLKQVVILAYFQSLKYSEIAEILNIPVGTVKSRLHTALLRLQEAWSETPIAPNG